MTLSVNVYDLNGSPSKTVELPSAFLTPIRPNLIRRVFVHVFSHRFQPQGRDILAGKRTSAESWGPGYGVARVPRMKGSWYPAAARAARAVGTVGGMRRFPTPVEAKRKKDINKKERRLAFKSALAALANKQLVEQRHGIQLPDNLTLPIVVVDEFADLKKTREIVGFLKRIGVYDLIELAKKKKHIRAGKGKMRGRRYQIKKSVLIVLHKPGAAVKAARNLVGVDVANAQNLSILEVAPGGHPGRLSIWTESAINMIAERTQK